MGVPRALAAGSLRLSLGWATTERRRGPRRWASAPTAVARLRAAPVRVLVAMSGGVDSSVAAALLVEAGHEVVGVTLQLWGGETDPGCCSVADVDDARRVADHLGLDHHIFNFGDDFDRHVVEPYVAGPRRGPDAQPVHRVQPPPQVRPLLHRARALGFDAVATGHHARVVARRRRDAAASPAAPTPPRTSPTCSTCSTRTALARMLLPVGSMTKADVRARAAALGLRTAAKPDSQDVCFIQARSGAPRLPRRPHPADAGRVVDDRGRQVGAVDAVELVTIGQRRGLGFSGKGSQARFVTAVDVSTATVTVGRKEDLLDRHGRAGRPRVGRRSRPRLRARPVQRPRRRPARHARRPGPDLVDPPAPDRPRPVRRVLRRRRGARRRDRSLTTASVGGVASRR